MAKKDECCILKANDVGMAMGALIGGLHLFWVILVALNIAKPIYDWILSLHFIQLSFSIGQFEIWTALTLIVFTTIVGYVMGYLFASVWNYFVKKK